MAFINFNIFKCVSRLLRHFRLRWEMNDRIRINGTMRYAIINNRLLYKFYSFFQQNYYLYLIIRCRIVFVGVSQSFPSKCLQYIQRWRRWMKNIE